jgi:hypothetical protein
VRDSRKSPVLWLDRILADSPPVGGRLQYGGGGERSELLGGGFAIDQLTARPLLEALPAVVQLRGHDGRAPEWLSGLIRMIAVEMASTRPGSEAVVSRLSDALLAQALRRCLLDADRAAGGSSAVSDPQIARALRLIRERPDHPWSVPELAAVVGMSRSAFAEQFRAGHDRRDADPEAHPLPAEAGGRVPAHDQRGHQGDRPAHRLRARGLGQ